VRRSKSSISDKDVPHFQIFAEMRRCTVVFSKTWKYGHDSVNKTPISGVTFFRFS